MAEVDRKGLVSGRARVAAKPLHSTGLLPAQEIRAMIRAREIQATAEIGEAQIQPASLDLRLGAVAYRVRASFLPGPGATVAERIEAFGMHRIDLKGGAVLERGCVYIVPLMESLALRSARRRSPIRKARPAGSTSSPG